MKIIDRLEVHSRLAATFLLLGLFTAGCTGEKNPSSAVKSELAAAKALAGETSGTAGTSCGSDEVSAFERASGEGMGEVIDLARESLPRGLYLARESEMMIEKKGDAGVARAIVREATGGKTAEVTCADSLEKISPESIDIVMTGLVKFDTTEKAAGSSITQRQFFFFQDKTSLGAVISNPKSLVAANQATDLKKLLTGPAAGALQMVRLPDRTYVLKYLRERDGVRARLIIHLDLVQ